MPHHVTPAAYDDASEYWTVYVDDAPFLTIMRPRLDAMRKGAMTEAFYPNGARAFVMTRLSAGNPRSGAAIYRANTIARDVVAFLNALET